MVEMANGDGASGRCRASSVKIPSVRASEDLGDLERIGCRDRSAAPGSGFAGARSESRHWSSDDLLDVEDHPVDRVIRPAERVVPAVLPRLGDQLAEQGRRELERLVGEDLVDQQLERLALSGAGDRA